MASAESDLHVEVAWSPAPREVHSTRLALPAGSTLAQALLATGWAPLACAAEGEPAFSAAGWSCAVWGRRHALGAALRDGDRIEVLRALRVAPMEARRARFVAAGGLKALRKRKHSAQFQR